MQTYSIFGMTGFDSAESFELMIIYFLYILTVCSVVV